MRRAPFIVVAPLVASSLAGCQEDQVIRNPAPPPIEEPASKPAPVATVDAGAPDERPIMRNPAPPSLDDAAKTKPAAGDDEGGW